MAKYFTSGINIGENNANRLPMPIILSLTYILPFTIKDFILSKTKRGITNKHALILTTNNQIFAIPGLILNARRPTENSGNGERSAFENAEFPPYDAVMPIIHTQAISYDLAMSGLKSLTSLPHDYESTSLVIASGVDLFVNYFAPEKV